MTFASLQHHNSFRAELESGIARTLKSAANVLQALKVEKGSVVDRDQSAITWFCSPRSGSGSGFLHELHAAEAKLLSWIDQSFALDISKGPLDFHELLNRSNLCRSQMTFGALMENERFRLEELLPQLHAALQEPTPVRQNIASLSAEIGDALEKWASAKSKILLGERLVPLLRAEDKQLVVPNSALTGVPFAELSFLNRAPQFLDASQAGEVLERIITGAPAEFAWAADLEAPRGKGIRHQLLLRPGRDGHVLRVMQHLGRIEDDDIRTIVLPDEQTLDGEEQLFTSTQERLLAKGGWAPEFTVAQREACRTIAGAVLLTLESLKQAVNFEEFAALGSEVSSCARYFLLEQNDRSSAFKVHGNLLMFQQPQLLDEWQHVPAELHSGQRCAWCSGLRVIAGHEIESEPHQGSRMLDTAMTNLARNNGFTRLLAKVLDGPPDIANRGAMRIHKQNGWKQTEHTFTEEIQRKPGESREVSWRLIYRDV